MIALATPKQVARKNLDASRMAEATKLRESAADVGAFHQALALPIPWHPDSRKPVRPFAFVANTRKRAPTEAVHIVVDVDVDEGGLHRKAGHLLCGGDFGLNGMTHDPVARRVDCQRCLLVSRRGWSRPVA